MPGKTPIQLNQNNYGSHENYLTRRSAAVVHPKDAAQIVPFSASAERLGHRHRCS